jgi:hypothetical protein
MFIEGLLLEDLSRVPLLLVTLRSLNTLVCGLSLRPHHCQALYYRRISLGHFIRSRYRGRDRVLSNSSCVADLCRLVQRD